ncbi:MAG TPA: DUF302 domain-containing protein [Candidatus Methylomirabilis sp.]|nr:DUF302 domain-containing protein [Candidatus Methylomirabilis sp.]
MNRLAVPALVFGLFAGAALSSASAAENDYLKLYTTRGDFDSVREDVEIAITNRGLVVDHVSHISDMLERTGKDLGLAGNIYGKAESLQFCSATVSRRMMQADPSNIVFCPYIVVIYTLPKDPKTVYVGYRRPQLVGSDASRTSLKAVEDLLDGIVKEALNLK